MPRFGEKEPFQFVDHEKIETDYRKAVESGALDSEKVDARKKELEKEYQERKEMKKQRQTVHNLAGDFAKAKVEMKESV